MIKLKKILWMGLFAVNSMTANMIFDLQDQYFENSYNQKVNASLYVLDKVDVSMNQLYQTKKGVYTAPYKRGAKIAGTFVVKLKKPIENFNVGIQAKYMSTSNSNSSPSIVLQSSAGKEHVIKFERHQIIIGSNQYKFENLSLQSLHINVEKDGNNLITKVNGVVLSQTPANGFNDLKRTSLTLIHDSYRGDITIDTLNDLSIFEGK